MQAAFRRRGGDFLGSISGRITIDSSPDLRLLLLQTLQSADCNSRTVDFYDVTYMDTSGLAVLLAVLRDARGPQRTPQLIGLREHARYLLEGTRLLRLFDEVDREV